MTTFQHYPCECDIPPEIEYLGAPFRLCHHSPASEGKAARDKIIELLAPMHASANSAEHFMEMPAWEQLRRYYDQIVGPGQAPLITPPEKKALTIAFAREAAIRFLLLQAALVADIGTPDPADPYDPLPPSLRQASSPPAPNGRRRQRDAAVLI